MVLKAVIMFGLISMAICGPASTPPPPFFTTTADPFPIIRQPQQLRPGTHVIVGRALTELEASQLLKRQSGLIPPVIMNFNFGGKFQMEGAAEGMKGKVNALSETFFVSLGNKNCILPHVTKIKAEYFQVKCFLTEREG